MHNQGIIHKNIISFLGTSEECCRLLGELESIEKNHEMLITQIDVLCKLLREKELYNEKIEELEDLCKRVKIQCTELRIIKNAFCYEYKLKEWNENVLTYERLGDIEEWLYKNSHGDNFCHFWDVKKLLEKVGNADMFQLLERLKQRCNFEKMIVIGGQGTGKTHGIANVVETQLEQGYHIPILIQAKSVTPQDEWKDMLIRVLGVSQMWSEDELWSALEALSYRNEINCPMSDAENEIHISGVSV